MNILVLNPPNVPFTSTSLLAPPLDVLSLATLIKTNFKTEFLDMDALRLKEITEDILIKTDVIVILIDCDSENVYLFFRPFYSSGCKDCNKRNL